MYNNKTEELLKVPEDCPESTSETVTAGLPNLVRSLNLGCLRLQQILDTVVQALSALNMNNLDRVFCSDGQIRSYSRYVCNVPFHP